MAGTTLAGAYKACLHHSKLSPTPSGKEDASDGGYQSALIRVTHLGSN
jgi:hypothetical protein